MRKLVTVIFLLVVVTPVSAERTQRVAIPNEMLGFYELSTNNGFGYGNACSQRDGAGPNDIRLGITSKEVISIIPSRTRHDPIVGVFTETKESRDEVLVIIDVGGGR